MRQVVLDTETTGLEVELEHRIIEIGCVEIFNRRVTGRHFHRYLNPERDIDLGAVEVHGLTMEKLASEPTFAAIREEFLEFVRDAELIIHNAAFDVAFLNAELGRGASSGERIEAMCRVLDSLALARQMHPGQRNSLDALCKRYSVDNSRRDYHGALLDARLLAEVYLAMTGGQAALILSAEPDMVFARSRVDTDGRVANAPPIVVIAASEEELQAHEDILVLLDKASAGKTVWRTL
ncbi:MAG TPA: DNA polymerase III subunit epsilon [Steroidobacteraceae bacterium]|jgi:DNA polymerase-3 subunit epsilon|nr:DNA polymerase III subunit epsilon [Steroidobacteraceae bacterium]